VLDVLLDDPAPQLRSSQHVLDVLVDDPAVSIRHTQFVVEVLACAEPVPPPPPPTGQGCATATSHYSRLASAGFKYRIRAQRIDGSATPVLIADGSAITAFELDKTGGFVTGPGTATPPADGGDGGPPPVSGAPAVAFEAYNNAPSTLVTGVPSVVPLDTIRVNTGEFVLATNQVTVNRSGKYEINYRVTIQSDDESDLEVWLEKNAVRVPGTTGRGFR
jgi:hypothetical protein